MNLIVSPHDCDNYYFRPDTTMVHTARDFYCPDEITVLEAAPRLRKDMQIRQGDLRFAKALL